MIQPLSTSRLLSCIFHKCTQPASHRKHDLSFYIFKIPDHMKHNLKANCYAVRVQSQLEMEGKKSKALSDISKPGSIVTPKWGPAAYHSETNKVLYQLTINKTFIHLVKFNLTLILKMYKVLFSNVPLSGSKLICPLLSSYISNQL